MNTLYEKRGRRYYPVAEERAWDSWPDGAHLVLCQPGSKVTRYSIEPDDARLLAAMEPVREALTRAVVEHSRMTTMVRPCTAKQQQVADEALRLLGTVGLDGAFEGKSAIAIADAAIAAAVAAVKGAK